MTNYENDDVPLSDEELASLANELFAEMDSHEDAGGTDS
jgi:hypothetical protein